MKRGTPDHPKVKQLADCLEIPRSHAGGILEFLWLYTARYSPGGDIGRWSDAVISDVVDWRKKPNILITALIQTRWLDVSQEHRLLVHDWPDHADDSVHMTLARATKLFADGRRPSLARFSKDERERLADLFDRLESVRTGKRIDAHKQAHTSVRTGVRTAKPQPSHSHSQATAKPQPSPLTVPVHVSKEEGESTTAASRNGRLRRWLPPSLPETIKATHERFPDVGADFLGRLAAKIEHAYGSVKNPALLLTDDLVAQAVRFLNKSGHAHQKSAGLWLTTVPECIRTWAVEGVAAPPLKPMEAMEERLKKKFEAKKEKGVKK